VDVLAQARLAHAIDKNDYHNFVLPAEEAANAALDNVHRQAATQPSVNVDHLLAADAAWQEAKAALLRWLLTANEKK
jgi:DTW domain-containing protein YfiP